MKIFLLSVFFLFVLITSAQAQWQLIQTTPALTNGYCVEAIGDSFVVISSYPNKILITNDGGKTWAQKSFPKNYAVDISLVDKNTFYAAADDGSFYKTIDGGNNWTMFYYNPSKSGFGNYIEMFTSTDGIAMGDGIYSIYVPLFLKTTDGLNWFETCNRPIGGGVADGWKSLDFVNSNIGYYSPKGGPAPRRLWRTTDGGLNWVETSFDIYADVLKFYNKDFGLLAHMPTIYRTTDGAVTWQDYSVLVPGFYPPALDIEFVPNNPNKVWMSYYNGLFFSNDSGKTWTQQNIPNLTHAFDINFTNEKTGWLLCTDGNLFYTNNCGGFLTNIVKEKVQQRNFELSQNYPNPFNPETVISYQLSAVSRVQLKVCDILGREVAALVNETQQPGFYTSQFSTRNLQLPSGIYLYRLTAGNSSSTKKMILLK